MQRSINELIGYHVGATDGEIGTVEEFYFDDLSWKIRYLIVKTGNWLSGRSVLLSPDALVGNSWSPGTFPVRLTKEQVRNSRVSIRTNPSHADRRSNYMGIMAGKGIGEADFMQEALPIFPMRHPSLMKR